MALQDRMMAMKPYFRGVEMYNEGLIVKVVFPDKWRVYGSADQRIKVAPSENKIGEYYFYASSEDTTYDDIFDLVEEVIKVNEETALKLKLLKDKIEEMKELFADNDFSKLSTLKFVMDDSEKNDKKQSRRGRKKKEEEKVVEQEEVQTNEQEEVQ